MIFILDILGKSWNLVFHLPWELCLDLDLFNPCPHLLFRHPRPRGVTPRLVCPLIEIELSNKDRRKDRDVLNLIIPDFTTLGQILTFPGQVKQKMLLFWEDRVFGK